MARIEFGSLKINELGKQYVNECLDSSWVTMGSKVKQFEQEFAQLFGAQHCVAVNSGTSADETAYLSLYEMGARRGDYIICPALAFFSMASSMIAAGFRPLFVDIRKETLGINEDLIEDVIKQNLDKRIIGLVAVSTMGRLPKMDQLRDICNKYNLRFILDACESYGAKYKNQFGLYWADIETTSFYIAHVLSCFEQGSLLTNNHNIDTLARMIRSHGRDVNSVYFEHKVLGGNFKPTDVGCAIGLSQIQNFWNNFKARKEVFNKMKEGLKNLPFWFIEEEDRNNCPHAFSIVPKDKNFNHLEFKKYLTLGDIGWKRNFGVISKHKAYPFEDNNIYPESEWADLGVHWGCHAGITDNDIDYLINYVRNFNY